MPNKLIAETSPYLLQHANNPVDWYPWGQEALNKASNEDKPILLSIGYSACHWCHVMEHECFENAAIAEKMNRHFVCIKVDREERPDLDKIYQTTHQMLTQRPGGWPLTLVLTPDGHAPFFAGTYFPPEPRHGMPGFGELIEKISGHYRQNKEGMQGHAESFQRALAKLNPPAASNPEVSPDIWLTGAIEVLKNQFDPVHGGFGGAPKFPHPTQIELLLRHAVTGAEQHDVSLAMASKTLRKMYQGGLFDQLGGGFYRYSVDKRWQIPHFEKMLYDNAQLLGLYTDAYCLTGNRYFIESAARTADWVRAEMQQPHGGYASTLDADSEGSEGKYYVWNETDLRAILSAPEYAAVESRFGLYGEPNFEGSWHFNINQDCDQEQMGEAWSTDLESALDKLTAERSERVRPALDDKILTAWNGLMIKSMARAGRKLALADLIESARQALDFVRTNLWKSSRMLASYREQEAKLNGYLDDYAFVAEGILELLQADWKSNELEMLRALCDAMIEHFEDRENGGFYFTSHDHEQLLHRPKPGADDAVPAANGAAASVLYRVGVLLGEIRYIDGALRTLELFSSEAGNNPSVYASLTMAGLDARSTSKTVVIRGRRQDLNTWKEALEKQYRPDTWIYPIPDSASALPEALAQKAMIPGKTVAYICRGFECSAPLESLESLQLSLNQSM
ncbi:MAG: thioredoxin domain-containing protein [Arenicellales bacterium]